MVKNLLAMWETWVWSLGQEDPLEKGMATHSSLLAWRIPWTEDPGELQSMGSQRVGPDWATDTVRSPPLRLLTRVFISGTAALSTPVYSGRSGSSRLQAGSLQAPRAGPALQGGARASHCGGSSGCRAQAPGARTSVVAARRLSRFDLLASVVVSYGYSYSETCGIFLDRGSNPSLLH